MNIIQKIRDKLKFSNLDLKLKYEILEHISLLNYKINNLLIEKSVMFSEYIELYVYIERIKVLVSLAKNAQIEIQSPVSVIDIDFWESITKDIKELIDDADIGFVSHNDIKIIQDKINNRI